MISYSQNQEDVVLSRLVTLIPEGFFVDVGAGHPILDNVTYALYEKGWRGINIEPMPAEVELLRSLRSEDVTYQVAVGDCLGQMTMYEAPIENRGSTTSSIELVNLYREQGQAFREFEVDVLPLNSLLSNHQFDDLHLLKIDVEGAEKSVLEGLDFEKYRPWVVLIEATKPQTSLDISQQWEGMILRSGYVKCLFDGLNNFYVRQDLLEIQKLMTLPANIFDDWQSVELGMLKEDNSHLRQVIESMHQNYLEEVEAYKRVISEATQYAQSQAERADRLEKYVKSLEKNLNL